LIESVRPQRALFVHPNDVPALAARAKKQTIPDGDAIQLSQSNLLTFSGLKSSYRREMDPQRRTRLLQNLYEAARKLHPQEASDAFLWLNRRMDAESQAIILPHALAIARSLQGADYPVSVIELAETTVDQHLKHDLINEAWQAAKALQAGSGTGLVIELSDAVEDLTIKRALLDDARLLALAQPHGEGAKHLMELLDRAETEAERTTLRLDARTAAIAQPEGKGARILMALLKHANLPAEKAIIRHAARNAAYAQPFGGGVHILAELERDAEDKRESNALRWDVRHAALRKQDGSGLPYLIDIVKREPDAANRRLFLREAVWLSQAYPHRLTSDMHDRLMKWIYPS
jgi:hypothetical protein